MLQIESCICAKQQFVVRFLLFSGSMDHFLKGWMDLTESKFEMLARMDILMRYIRKDTYQTVMDTIIALVGKPESEDQKFYRWPAVIDHIINKRTMYDTDMLVWSAFCFHNGIPFGLMVAYPHLRGMLRNEDAYLKLMATWSNEMSDGMRSMAQMKVVERAQ